MWMRFACGPHEGLFQLRLDQREGHALGHGQAGQRKHHAIDGLRQGLILGRGDGC